jgi:hypothetical protein
MAWDREKRGIFQRKQEKPQIKKHKPLKSEGNDGDISIRQLSDGVFLFFKALGKWYKTLNTSSQVIPEPDAPRSLKLGSPAQPVETMYVSENSLHIGNTKSEQGKISLSSDKTDLVFKNKAGTESKIVGKKAAASGVGSAIDGSIILGSDNTSNKEGILHLGSGTSNNGGIITSTTNYSASAMGLRIASTASSGSTMQHILSCKTTAALAVANKGVILSTYDGPHGAISLSGATTGSTEASGLAGMGTIWVSDDDKLYYRFGTGTAVDLTAGGGGTEITLTDTAPTSSSDFSSTDIILEKDTGKLWWYSDTNSKLYYHTYDSYVDLDFNIASFSDNLTSTFFIKDEGQTVGNISYNLTMNNPASSTFTGTISLSGTTNSSQAGSFPLDFDQTDCSGGGSLFTLSSYNEGSTIPLLYPDNSDSWSSGAKVITSSASVDDGSGAEALSTSITFKNKKFYGYTTATDPTAGGFNIYDLQTASYVTTSYTQSVTTINTSAADNYFYYAYPARISGTPVFKINGLTETGFTLSTTTKTNQASNGYSESYKVWKSPQIYNDATFTIEVS